MPDRLAAADPGPVHLEKFMTSRRWIFVLNNWTTDEKDSILRLGEDLEAARCRYLIVACEVGSEGTPHLQGYVEFSSTKRMRGVKLLLGARCHVEIARGTGTENRAYVRKDREEDEVPNDEVYEFGELRQNRQGARTDLQRVQALIRDGQTETQIADQYFSQWVRYRQSFNEYRALINRTATTSNFALDTFPEEWRTIHMDRKALILWGPPNIGKTQFALALIGKALMVSHIDDLKDFDPDIHEGIVFDDMSFSHMPVSAQIHLVDWDFDRSIHIRYGLARIPQHTRKIFTTNTEGGEIFNLASNLGVRRRVEIHHLDKLE